MSGLFGKDGMRGLAVTELTCEMAMQVGRAAAVVFADHNDTDAKILIGKDVRGSADPLEAALCAGICSMGVDAELIGEVPTPALAWLTKERGAKGGIMITASHVNHEFNGIKLFSSYGYRLGADREDEIERLILEDPDAITPVPRMHFGRVHRYENAIEDYIAHVQELAPADLSGLKVAVDCAHGCASLTAERIFTELGAEVEMMGNSPDGANINTTGSTCLRSLMLFVKEKGCAVGIAFDGAAERCLAVDENGSLVDGDVIIALCADVMKKRDKLRHNTILVTQANNLGLLQFARSKGIATSSAPTGERSMVRRMLECGFSIGGDPAGQIIFPDDQPSADGQLTGIRLLQAFKSADKPMSELSAVIEKCPQVMLNVPITKKFREVWKNDRAITGLIDEFEEILGDDGRVVVRETGREPMIRIRLEGRDFSTINTMALQIADTIKERMELKN